MARLQHMRAIVGGRPDTAASELLAPSPAGVVLLAGALGLLDVRVRGEGILWANLGVKPQVVYALYAAAAIPAEALLALVLS